MSTIPTELHFTQSDPLTARFSRTLGEQSLHSSVSSAEAEIVPMDAEEPMHQADALVIKWSVRCAAALFVIYLVEWFTS